MNNPLISVIVPIFNSETYLHRMIESVICQSYENLEILLIDDGSTDSSKDIIEYFSQRDKRIKAFFNDHSGPSVARNYGIEHSNGEFISFMDSDDYLEPNFYDSFFLEGTHFDIIFQGYIREYNSGKSIEVCPDKLIQSDGDCNDIIYYLRKKHLLGWSWIKLIKRTIIEEHQIRFNTSISWREDSLFSMQLCKHVRSICVLPICGYHYCIREDSLSHSIHNLQMCLYLGQQMWVSSEYLHKYPKARIYEENYYLDVLKKVLHLSYKQHCSFQFRNDIINKIVDFSKFRDYLEFSQMSKLKSHYYSFLFRHISPFFINLCFFVEHRLCVVISRIKSNSWK